MISQRHLRDRFILPRVYSIPMTKTQHNSQVVKMAIMTGIVIMSAMTAIQVVKAQELLNTATNEIAEVNDMGYRDVLEEIYAELSIEAQDTESIFIVVDNGDGTVGLFGVYGYPWEDYEEAGQEVVELEQYSSIMSLWEELAN